GGNLYLFAGNGNDTFTLGTVTAGAPNSFVGGSVFENLGNGSDSTLVTALVGGTVNSRSGNGGSVLRFGDNVAANVTSYQIAVQFGNGDDTLTLATNGTYNGSADGGGRLNANPAAVNGPGNIFYQFGPNNTAGNDSATLAP